ncbi:pyridoxamine 5'-phosphate oxidase family protein [Actinomadura parmotrematis]|uniref:Pyridoxamine 5'-phosphate oxidase family protein n=1 Tax=Actinomadura parmotrematis TaxID=2864039 RepID=A0ABS7FV19_9ACTN|nr:pyridoxamine 5'-phosphate oxidase family protein [Actinomadura parmotrematis]MBW8483432.1 pyridoxamine 5'-phosphate oxidase family protein [Actinomadura parmotrematis]
MTFDRSGLRVLDEAECRALLAAAPLGRVVFTERALPAVQPVGFALRGRELVVGVAPGSPLAGLARGTVVAFEADAYDAAGRTGWSVVVVGPARPARPDEVAGALPVPSWPAPAAVPDRYLVIGCELVSGRRIPQAPATAPYRDVRPC